MLETALLGAKHLDYAASDKSNAGQGQIKRSAREYVGDCQQHHTHRGLQDTATLTSFDNWDYSNLTSATRIKTFLAIIFAIAEHCKAHTQGCGALTAMSC